MSQISLLYTLQQTDTDILTHKKKLMDVLAALKQTERVDAARDSAESTRTTLRNLQKKQKDEEFELASLGQKAKEEETKLYSGRVKQSRELLDLQKEVELLKKRYHQLEEQLFELLVAVESAQKANQQAEEEYKELAAAWEKETAELAVSKQKLALALNDLLQKRDKVTPQIDQAYLNSYEELRRKKRNVAVVELIRANLCGGCNTTVSNAVIKAVREGKVSYCNTCERMLIAALSRV